MVGFAIISILHQPISINFFCLGIKVVTKIKSKHEKVCDFKAMSGAEGGTVYSACIKGSLGVRDSQKLAWDFQKSMPGSLGLPTFKDI